MRHLAQSRQVEQEASLEEPLYESYSSGEA
jgi:hypothetical protein